MPSWGCRLNRWERLAQIFAAIDADNSGEITQIEFIKARRYERI